MPSTQGLPARIASISLLAELHGESLVLRMFGLSWGTDGSGVTDQCIPSTRTLRTHSTASSVMPSRVAPLATVESWGTRPSRSMQPEPRTVLPSTGPLQLLPRMYEAGGVYPCSRPSARLQR